MPLPRALLATPPDLGKGVLAALPVPPALCWSPVCGDNGCRRVMSRAGRAAEPMTPSRHPKTLQPSWAHPRGDEFGVGGEQ